MGSEKSQENINRFEQWLMDNNPSYSVGRGDNQYFSTVTYSKKIIENEETVGSKRLEANADKVSDSKKSVLGDLKWPEIADELRLIDITDDTDLVFELEEEENQKIMNDASSSKNHELVDMEDKKTSQMELVECEKPKKSYTFRDIFKKPNFKILVNLTIVMIVIFNLYGITLLINQEMGFDNPYMNGMLLGVSEITGNVLCFLLVDKLGRRTVNKMTNISLVLFSLIILAASLMLPKAKESLYNSELVVSKDLLFTCKNFFLIIFIKISGIFYELRFIEFCFLYKK